MDSYLMCADTSPNRRTYGYGASHLRPNSAKPNFVYPPDVK